MEGVECIKYSASPKLGWRGGGKGRVVVKVVEVVKVKVVG